MYYASDKSGNRVFIDNAQKGIDYYCPACKAKMIMKCGDIVAHHFSHKARKLCDPWYKDRMSDWHRKLQSMFPEDCQEVTVWNDSHSEVHFADVMFSYKGTGHVLEFQHSPITRKEFISRSSFYLGLGYKLTWIFDFCECEKPKKILYTRKNTTEHEIDLVWPGSDRVRFLDNLDRFQYAEIGNFHIVFHICTGLGKEVEHSLDNGFSWSTWEYVNPFQKEYCFVEPRSMCLDNLADFEAIYYDEEEFYELLSITANRAKRERNNKANATGTPCHK